MMSLKIGKINLNMGGDKNRVDPTSYHKWKKNKDMWTKITDGGLIHTLKTCIVIILERWKGLLMAGIMASSMSMVLSS